jgi:hypothetical protein
MPLTVVVSLTVRSTAQTGLGKQPIVDLSLPFELDLRLEDVDLPSEIGWDGVA